MIGMNKGRLKNIQTTFWFAGIFINENYSGLTLNQYGVDSPCRTICTVRGFVALS
ncbi:hypothetical protein [Neisseria sicca]|uniref:hypothetical protein n=1 Tax=Neisseria sicca TaxID=490 RepID=UPI000AF24B62|nr:hypothetical protein [Neisseria sicca]